jgi:hypothetical protein
MSSEEGKPVDKELASRLSSGVSFWAKEEEDMKTGWVGWRGKI